MIYCNCGNSIPTRIKVDGKYRILKNRVQCLTCIPFGTSSYSKRFSPEERKLKNAAKQRKHYRKHVEIHGVGRPGKIKRSRKTEMVQALGGACMQCGYSRCMRNITFHHVKDKEFVLAERSFQYSWKKLIPEISKCVLLCHNCHGEVHAGLIDVSLKLDQTLTGVAKFLAQHS